MKVVPFSEFFLKDIVKSFVDIFPSWSIEKASIYLMQCYVNNPEFCYVCINEEGDLFGGIFCKVGPHNRGTSLIVESLQVIEKHRNKGIGAILLRYVINNAREKGIISVNMLTSTQNEFPLSWYKKIGFRESGWVEISASIDEIDIN